MRYQCRLKAKFHHTIVVAVWFETGRRLARSWSSRFELFRHVEIARTCSNLVADRFAAGLSQIPLRYPGRRQVRSWWKTGPKLVADLLARASSLLAS